LRDELMIMEGSIVSMGVCSHFNEANALPGYGQEDEAKG